MAEHGKTQAIARVVMQTSGGLVPAALAASARGYAAASKAQNTKRAYRADWLAFERWCTAHGAQPLPAAPEALALYIASMADAGRKAATIERALAAIAQAHKTAGHESPRGAAPVRAVMQGIRRTHGTAPTQKAPVLVGELRAMVEALPATLKGTRDRALLLVGFAGAFRRSELVALDVADLDFGADGLTVMIRRSKTDQEAVGRKVGIPFGSSPATCPVRALRAWLEIAEVTTGPAFVGVTRHGKITASRLSPGDVARVVKGCATAAGLDASRFAGHSLRAGLATAAAKAGKSERAIMGQTGHRSTAMVRRYIRDAELFTDNAAAGLL